MHLGALCALVEVGIALNMAFGVVQTFRNWLRDHVSGSVKRASMRIRLDLADIDAGPVSNGTIPIERVQKIEDAFVHRTARCQPYFVALAILTALGQILILAYIAPRVDEPCDVTWVPWVTLLAVGPIGLWWGLVGAYYARTTGQLLWIEYEYRHGIEMVRQLTAGAVQPTEPDGVAAESSTLTTSSVPPANSARRVVASPDRLVSGLEQEQDVVGSKNRT